MSNEQSIRDELIELLDSPQHAPMSTHSQRDGSCQDCPWPLSHLPVEDMADEILSSPVIRRIQAEAGAKALERAADAINKDFQSLPSWDATYKAGERTEDWEKGCTRTLVDTMDWLRGRAASIRADAIERGETA